MNPQFEVEFETELRRSNDYNEDQHIILLDVIPQSLSLNCPHCQVYSVMRFDSTVKRFETDDKYGVSFQMRKTCFSTLFVAVRTVATLYLWHKPRQMQLFHKQTRHMKS